MADDDPHATLPDGETPLHHAARQYDGGAAVAALLARGADPRRPDRFGRGALWASIQGETGAIVPLLVRAGADPNAPNAAGELLLPTVTGWRNAHAARILVEAGADPQRPQRDGTTALGLALGRGDVKVVEALVGEAQARELLASRIDSAAIRERKAAVVAALRAGATAYHANKEGSEELSWSPQKGRYVIHAQGDGGTADLDAGDDASALDYLYEQEIREHTRELDLWDDYLRRFTR